MLKDDRVPEWVRALTSIVERVGFPIAACCFMFYLSYYSMHKMEVALIENTKAMQSFISTSGEFQRAVLADHARFLQELQRRQNL